MAMEKIENITDQQVIDWLREKLSKLKADLVSARKIADSGLADDEDEIERNEEGEEKSATSSVLEKDIENIERKIAWVEKNGNRCASPDCPNLVEEGRRRLGGVTCPEHMDDEESILDIRETTS